MHKRSLVACLLFSAAAIDAATLFTSVNITDSLNCGNVSNTGIGSAAATFSETCPGGHASAFGTGSAAAGPDTVDITGSGTDSSGFLPMDHIMIHLMASASRWVEVIGTGSGDLDFTIATHGQATADTGLAQGTLDFDVAGINQGSIPCSSGLGVTPCGGSFIVSPILVTYGVPFQLTLSLTGMVQAAAGLQFGGGYTLTSGQTLVDIPEPGPQAFLLLGVIALAIKRAR